MNCQTIERKSPTSFIGELQVEAEKSERWIDPRFKAISIGLADPGPFIKLDDGSLMVVSGNTTLISEDGGRSWSEPRAIYTGAGPGVPTRSAQAVKATDADGRSVIVLIWGEDFQVTWDSARVEPTEDSTADVWAIRSLDGGRTWIDRQRIFEGICSHIPSNIVQAKSGRISAPVQFYMRNPARNVIRNYVSDDAGQTWQGSNIVDLRGEGHHDGAVEPTMVELKDGRLWMLIRTNWDRFWEAYSDDQGLSWRVIQPSNIDASTSPGFLERLASGRLVLIWNRLYPEGKKSFPSQPAQVGRLAR